MSIIRFPTDMDAKSSNLKNEDKLMLSDSDVGGNVKSILLSVLRAFLNFVDNSDTSSTDNEIVLMDGTGGKNIKSSGITVETSFNDKADEVCVSSAIMAYILSKIPYIAYGEIFGHDNTTAKTIPTGAIYTKIDNAFTANGVSENITPQYTLGQLTVPKEGKYRVFYTLSYTGTVNNTTWFGAIFLNGVEQNNIHSATKITSATDIRTSAGQGIIIVPANGVIDFRVRHDQAGNADIIPKYININAVYLGDGE